MSPCHVSLSRCLHFSMFLCLMFMSPCLIFRCLHVSMSVLVSMCPEFRTRNYGTKGKQKLPLFAANGKRKRQTSVCFLRTDNGSLFSLVGKTINGINDCCFRERAHLCQWITSELQNFCTICSACQTIPRSAHLSLTSHNSTDIIGYRGVA
jgi:hypothetical protein